MHNLRPPRQIANPGYLLRQLCMQACELSEERLAGAFRDRLDLQPSPCLILLWTTRTAGPARPVVLGQRPGNPEAIGVLPDGRIVTGWDDGRILVWDPNAPDASPAEIGRHDSEGHRTLLALLPPPDGRVITCRDDGRILACDPRDPMPGPAEIGRDPDAESIAVLPGSRVVTGGKRGRLLIWTPDTPGAPIEIGGHGACAMTMAVLPDGRVAAGTHQGAVAVWNLGFPARRPGRRRRPDAWDPSPPTVAALPPGRVVGGIPTASGSGSLAPLSRSDPSSATTGLPACQ